MVTILEKIEHNIDFHHIVDFIEALYIRVKILEDKDNGRAEPAQEDALIKRGKEMVNVLSSMEAANILTGGVTAVSVSLVAAATTVSVPTVNGLFPTASAIFTTTSVRKLQEQIDAQVAKEIEEEYARENSRLNEQLARDSEIARLHAEEELKRMIEGRTGTMKGMTLEEIKENFILVWKQLEDFMPMSSTGEAKRVKRKGLKLDQGSTKKMKTSEDVSEEDLKRMMQLVPVEEIYVEALQVKHPIINWEIHSEGKKDYWKIIRLG
nr:hypothetical protein [Tanacetum cinerariifolium]